MSDAVGDAEAASTDNDTEAEIDPLSVTQLNARIDETLQDAPALDGVACRGEVSDLYTNDTSVFFDLSDASTESDEVISCFIFRSRYERFDIDLEDGIEVLVTDATVDYYTEGGRLNLKPGAIALSGEGSRQARIDRLSADLDDRGWFDAERKRDIPEYPACVGVATSRDGDARYDIEDEIQTRHPGVDILLHHSKVQGDTAPESLAQAIAALDDEEEVDVMIVGRGGGSDTELMAFNTELVAEAVFHAETPTVSAVGHHEDGTIVCRVADDAANTPTAAGGLVCERETALDDLDAHEDALEVAYMDGVAEDIDGAVDTIESAYTHLTETRLDELETRLVDAYRPHERQAALSEATNTYKIALAVLVVLVLALLVLVGLML